MNIESKDNRRNEVIDWLENLSAAYENYLDFAKFPGKCDAHIAQSPMTINYIIIVGIKQLCEYGDIPYKQVTTEANNVIYEFAHNNFVFFDIVPNEELNEEKESN